MNAFLGKVKRTSEYIAMMLFFIAAFFVMLYYIGNFAADFMPVLGNLFSMLLDVGIWLIVPVCIAMRKRSCAKWASIGVSLYWLITSLFDLLSDTAFASSTFGDLLISVGVFSFLTACALVVMTVFFAMSMAKKDQKKKLIAFFIFLGILVFYLVLFSLWTAASAKWGSTWNSYFRLVYTYLVIPFAMLFIAIAFGFKEGELVLPLKPKAKKAVTEAPAPMAEESKEEPPALEESAAEAPVEETGTEEKAEEAPVEERTEDTTDAPAEKE